MDELLTGINDSEDAGNNDTESNIALETDNSSDNLWEEFLSILKSDNAAIDKDDRMVCKLDRDIAASIDQCDIFGRSRSDIVNALLRVIFKKYLSQFAAYRREQVTLFANLNKD